MQHEKYNTKKYSTKNITRENITQRNPTGKNTTRKMQHKKLQHKNFVFFWFFVSCASRLVLSFVDWDISLRISLCALLILAKLYCTNWSHHFSLFVFLFFCYDSHCSSIFLFPVINWFFSSALYFFHLKYILGQNKISLFSWLL